MASSSPRSGHFWTDSGDTQNIPLSGPSVHIARRSADNIQHLLRTRFHCKSQILGLDLDSRSGRPHIDPERHFEHTLQSSGVKVSVWKADLTNFSADAVVNAANSKLQHYGGLALALSQAGGPEIQKESDDYVQKHGHVRTGDAVYLGAGNLKCKMIIHAVGPHLSFRPNPHEVSASKVQLERVIKRILEIVERKRLETVAIPAISSGLFNFPVDECADVIVETVKWFYEYKGFHTFKPKEVLLVNHDDPTVKEMERACLKILSHTPASYSQAVATTPAKGQNHQTGGAKAESKPREIQFGLVRVLLRKGCLEEQKMDVIVNTIGTDRNLNVGHVSKMLLQKAGPKLQQEISKASFSGSVLITRGFGLGCKEVYHTCCPLNSSPGSEQALFRLVRECLWLAVAANRSSIAFPAIGTGNLGFFDDDVARIMLSAALDFAVNFPFKPLEVHFVIFPSDVGRYKTFEKELKSFQPKAFHKEPPTNFQEGSQNMNSKPAPLSPREQASAAWNREDKGSVSSEPLIRLQCASEERRIEAKTWLESVLFNHFSMFTICNNFIQHLGEKELEELSNMQMEGVSVEEFLQNGRCGFTVSGSDAEDIAVTALRLEKQLQDVQEEFVKEEKEELKRVSRSKAKLSEVSESEPQIKPLLEQLQSHGLKFIKAERVENVALEKQFKLQKDQMPSRSSETLLQLVSAQFYDVVSLIGFRPECAPPDDQSLGEGLYFAADMTVALKLWTGSKDKFIYVFVAEVLKAKSGPGRPGLVLGPESGSGSKSRCDSVEGSGVTVVFNHCQTLPRFILTCRKIETETTAV
ncbi:hypothetical protein WMY93_002212 [Mugilogobius chulae]|uniref:Macro domain-containing protein n=1 Tax=Mugilogobius chulae TaxID=88201 RepID=A0AAW0Q850_9GOBI